MDVSLPLSNSSELCVGDTPKGSVPQDTCNQDAGFLAQLRGPPRMEKLLSCLAQALISTTQRKVASVPSQKDRNASTHGKVGVEGVCQQDTTMTSFDDDCIFQEAFLNELCLYLSSGKDTLETSQIAAVSLPLPLPVPTSGRNPEVRAIFTRLAGKRYWRRALLIPLLRRWSQKEKHSFFSSFLLQKITDVIGKGFLSLYPSDGNNKMENKEQGACKSDEVKTYGGLDYMQELEELLKATGSFRGFCMGIDVILRNNLLRLMELLNSVVVKDNVEVKGNLLTGSTRAALERAVDVSTHLTWKDVFAFLSRCVADVEAVFCESLWMFLMSLLSGYAGALQLHEVKSFDVGADFSVVPIQAQRMYIECMQRDLLGYLTVCISTDRVASGKSLMTVQNVLCRQPFFWRTAMEVELAPELLPLELLSRPDVRLWAQKCAATSWGNVLRLVQLLVHGKEAAEEVPDSVGGADLVTSSIRQRYSQLLEEHVERLKSLKMGRFAGKKRPRTVETDSDEESVASTVVWSTYTTEFFLRTYHPSCFTILSLVEQDTFVALLRQLHGVIVNEEHEAVRLSITTLSFLHDDNKANVQEALLDWHAYCVHNRVVQALREDALLTMCLLRAVFIFFERIGKTNLNVHDVLRKLLLPILASLCWHSVNDSIDHDTMEEYYESQQGIVMLLASGLLALPWDIRGVRIRLLLYKFIGESLQDCFSAEEALSEADHIFALYADKFQAPEEAAATLCGNVGNDPFIERLALEGEGAATAADVIDDFLRCEAPVQFPAPCGTLLLMSVFSTLSRRFLGLRAEWDQQVRLLGEDAKDYLGREATFCTSRDIVIFRFLVQLAHRMVLGFQVQLVSLLRMWLSYLNHLFTSVVPPLTEDDEIVLLLSNKTKNAGCGVGESSRSAYRRSPNESPQGELRVVLGELLADLALMPLVDSEAVMQCPAAVPYRPGGTKWQQQRSQRVQDVLILQRVLPTLVLEELCFALRIPTDDVKEQGLSPGAARRVGKMVEQSFLGVLGVVALYRRLELFMVPESLTDKRCAALLQVLWSAIEASSITANRNVQQAAYILPFLAGASCSMEDAQRLFARCQDHHLDEGSSWKYNDDGNDQMKTVFEESVITLERLGLFSLTHDGYAPNSRLGAKIIHRAPVITIELQSLDVGFFDKGEKEEAVLFQLLHGVILPTMYSRLAAHVASAAPSSRKSRLMEEVSAELCLALLRQLKGPPLTASDSACRFTVDLVNQALIVGVRERVLHPCGNGLFRLHQDMVQQSSLCLLVFQWWWWKRVDAFLRRAVLSCVEVEKPPLEAWIDAAQTRVRHLIDKRDGDLPQFLLRRSINEVMSLVADVARCWVPNSSSESLQMTAVSEWQLHLSDEARVALALKTVKSIKSCLARRPAGVSVNELSKLISWPTISNFLRKKSLSKALTHFSSSFDVATVQGILVAQLALQRNTEVDVNAAEAAAWLLMNHGKFSSSTTGFVQEIDLVVRAVTFLRKRQLRQTSATFEELCAAVVPSKGNGDGSALLDVLRRYDVVAGFDTEETVSWASVQQKVVRLSPREFRALKVMEAYRKKAGDRNQLYEEAIKPFLCRCDTEVAAGELSGATMPIALLGRWLQIERLYLQREDLFEMLHEFSSTFLLDEESQCIRLGHNTTMGQPKTTLCTPRVNEVQLPPPHLPPPPPPPMSHSYQYTFNSQLLRVLNSKQMDALLQFAEATIYAVFVLLLPQLSAPSGVRLQNLLRRVRWGSVAPTLGSLPSFVEAFDGIFFDVFVDTNASPEDVAVAAYRGPVGVWLLYARLIARIFPCDVDIPLRIVAEGLSWSVRFASRFGDLPSLLRRVGRSCHGGYLLAKDESVVTTSVDDDVILWEIVEKVRQSLSPPPSQYHQQEQQLEEETDAAKNQLYVLVEPRDFSRHVQSIDLTATDRDWMQLADTAVRRFPFFFQWHTAINDPAPILRVALTDVPAPEGLVAFVEEYVCPLLSQQYRQHGVRIAELDDRLGWSRGWFDTHPAGVRAVGGVASSASLFGILRRYMEAVHPPWLLLNQNSTEVTPHGDVIVRPNTDVYQSPEDMLLHVNGLEYVAGENGLLRPSGRPVSLFEVLAEEQELRGRENTLCTPRAEQWYVSLQCEANTFDKWEEDFAKGKGDILVWCES